ncbi:MAG: potassium transporter TrkA [Anaerolineae bacterium]|nr:potassium transporter TrkA [Anaerolineae bacterium]
MKKITVADRLRYAFDNYMANGTIALIGALALLSAAIIACAVFVIQWFEIVPGGQDQVPDVFESAWLSLVRTLDAGAVSNDQGWAYRIVMLGVTTGGIFIVSALIGVLSNGLERTFDRLRKGRSFVVEHNHTLIIGWSPKIFQILTELSLAEAKTRRPCVVILANKDKLEMEEEIWQRCGRLGRLHLICRTGSPIDPRDIEIANPYQAAAIILLAPDSKNSDAHVIKQLLALVNNPNRSKITRPLHIVAELHSRPNAEVAKMVGKAELEVVLSADLITRITAQTCRQPGLSTVYLELMSFEGVEIYFREAPTLIGRTYGEALLSFEYAAVMGICDVEGRTVLNPPMGTLIAAGDRMIAIAENEDMVRTGGVPIGSPDLMRDDKPRFARPERTLLLGWNPQAAEIIRELDSYVANGSQLTVVAIHPAAEAQISELREVLTRQQIMFFMADITNPKVLDAMRVHEFDHVILLSYHDLFDDQQADAHTLVTLLHLRQITDRMVRSKGRELSIVSEMMDLRNRELAEVTRADDFIVSDSLVSLMLAQVSKNKRLSAIFDEFFDADGCEIYLKPIEDYVQLDAPMTFYTLVEAARRRGDSVIGFRNHTLMRDTASHGIVLNPAKFEKFTFHTGDKAIVLSGN